MTTPDLHPLAQRVLDFAARRRPGPCEVCGEPCSWNDDEGRTIHPTCLPTATDQRFPEDF